MPSPRNFGESSIDAGERDREGGGEERERPHRRNSTLGRTPARIFRDAKIKARVLQVCTRSYVCVYV